MHAMEKKYSKIARDLSKVGVALAKIESDFGTSWSLSMVDKGVYSPLRLTSDFGEVCRLWFCLCVARCLEGIDSDAEFMRIPAVPS